MEELKHLIEPRWGLSPLPKNGLTMIDFFCGSGVGAVGFLLAGYKIVYAVDNKKYAVDNSLILKCYRAELLSTALCICICRRVSMSAV